MESIQIKCSETQAGNDLYSSPKGLIERIWCTVACISPPLIMTLPGLSCRWINRVSIAGFLLYDLAPSWLENFVLLSTAHRLVLRCSACKSNLRQRAVPIIILTLMSFFVCLFGAADYSFQKTTGLVPDRFIVGAFPSRWRDDLSDEVETDLYGVIFIIMSVIHSYFAGVFLYTASVKNFCRISFCPVKVHNPVLYSNALYAAMIGVLLVTYILGGWTPVTNITLCWVGFPYWAAIESTHTPEMLELAGYQSSNVQRSGVDESRPNPNIILIVADSLSGAIMDTQKGREKMPFFYEEMANMKDMYRFKYGRTISGSTTTALPAILTGLNPFTEEGHSLLLGTSLAGELKPKGYDSVMFCSWKILRQKNTPFLNLATHLTSSFDEVYDPITTNTATVQASAMDDRTNVAYFKKWLNERSAAGNSQPFFAVIYLFNSHAPWMVEKEKLKGTGGSVRYLEGLHLIDGSYREIFDAIESVNMTKETMLVGTGDHGDRPGLHRVAQLDDFRILHVPIWMRIPKKILPLDERKLLLKREDELVSTLDVMPTLRHVLGLGTYTKEETDECVTGIDLLRDDDSPPRTQVGWSGHPQELYVKTSDILSFTQRDRALIIYVDNLLQSREVEFPIYGSNQNEPPPYMLDKFAKDKKKPLDDLDWNDRSSWAKIIEDYNLTQIVKAKLPNFHSLLKVE